MQPGPDTAIVGMLVWQMLAVHMPSAYIPADNIAKEQEHVQEQEQVEAHSACLSPLSAAIPDQLYNDDNDTNRTVKAKKILTISPVVRREAGPHFSLQLSHDTEPESERSDSPSISHASRPDLTLLVQSAFNLPLL
jgi:hypothetical protein